MEENTDRNSISLDKNQYKPSREKEPIPASCDAGKEIYPTQEKYPVNSNSSIAEASSPSTVLSTQIPNTTSTQITLRFVTKIFDDEFKQYSHNRTYSDIMNKIIEELLKLEDTDKHIILDTNQEYVYENILRLFQIPFEMFSIEVSDQIYSTMDHLQRIITYPTTKTNLTILMAQMDILGTIYKQHVLKWKHRVRKDMTYELQSGYYSYKNICKFIFNYSKVMLEYSNIISESKPIEEIFKQVYDYIVKRLSGVIYVMGPMTFDMNKHDPGYIQIVNKLLYTTLSKYTSSIGVSDTAYNSMVHMVQVNDLIDDSKRKNHPETPLSSIRNKFFS